MAAQAEYTFRKPVTISELAELVDRKLVDSDAEIHIKGCGDKARLVVVGQPAPASEKGAPPPDPVAAPRRVTDSPQA